MQGVRLMVIDVDGTLLTPDKVLTERAVRAVRQLREARVEVALTSGRPPRGLNMLIEPLGLTTPLAAFNGGMSVKPDITIIEQRTLSPEAARQAVELIRRHGLDVWVYREADWYLTDPGAPHVAQEQRAVRFSPTVLATLGDLLDRAVKIVGVSDDLAAVARCEAEAQHLGGVSAARSQPYYLDVTHPDANKGMVVKYLSHMLCIPRGQTATIGDMPNDVQMFRGSRVSIAMGNASAEVKRQASSVLRRQQNTTVMMAEVKSIDLDERLLMVDDGTELTYDYLVIAAGAKPSYFGHDQWMIVHVFYLIGFRNRLAVMLEWAWAYVTRRSRPQIITGGLPADASPTASEPRSLEG
jgi:Cof subfamily protein (haloacid dehalogenase superfamily)